MPRGKGRDSKEHSIRIRCNDEELEAYKLVGPEFARKLIAKAAEELQQIRTPDKSKDVKLRRATDLQMTKRAYEFRDFNFGPEKKKLKTKYTDIKPEMIEKIRLEFYMQEREVKSILDSIKYKPGWSFEWIPTGNNYYIQVSCPVRHTITDENTTLFTTTSLLTIAATRENVIAAIFQAIEHLELHEARELFSFQGKRIYFPHQKLETLMAIAPTGPAEDHQLPKI